MKHLNRDGTHVVHIDVTTHMFTHTHTHTGFHFPVNRQNNKHQYTTEEVVRIPYSIICLLPDLSQESSETKFHWLNLLNNDFRSRPMSQEPSSVAHGPEAFIFRTM